MRVLVVDDTQSVRERLASLIAAIDGVEHVEQAADGVSGLASVATKAPDVLVLDIWMPRMNGFELLAAVKRRKSPPPMCIVVSNHAAYRTHALAAGASQFFDKSTQLDSLLASLSELATRNAVQS